LVSGPLSVIELPIDWSKRRVQIVRLARYSASSIVAFGVSEGVLLLLYGTGVLGATAAALVANLVGTLPSYLMSRYWIWKEAPRTRVGRQVVMYWATSFACIAGTSLATGAIANLAPPGHPFHLAIVGVGFLLVSVVFWVAKFVIYQRVIFPVSPSTGNIEVAAPEAGTAAIGASSVNGAIASRSAEATDRSIPAAASRRSRSEV
jgi:putative flippase GtrA